MILWWMNIPQLRRTDRCEQELCALWQLQGIERFAFDYEIAGIVKLVLL